MIGSRDQPNRCPFQFQGVRSTPRTNYRPLKINPDGKLIKLSALRTRAVGNIGGGEIDHQKPAVGIDAFEWRIRLLGIRALPPPHRAPVPSRNSLPFQARKAFGVLRASVLSLHTSGRRPETSQHLVCGSRPAPFSAERTKSSVLHLLNGFDDFVWYRFNGLIPSP